jgi:pimeloyl-ACP methyl ester carboxylesterase
MTGKRLLLVACLAAAACRPTSLDGFLYDPLPSDGYQLSTAVIPIFQDFFVDTPDGEQIHTVFIPAGPTPAGAPSRRVTLIYFHGQSNNIGTTWPRIELLYPLGYNILVVDPRGYGLSTGTPSEEGIKIDLAAVHAELLRRADVDSSALVYYGRSFGGALAIHLATVSPPAVLITESAFTSVEALVKDGAYADLPRSFVAESRWDNLSKIRSIRAPYLALHGTDDPYVQFRYAVELTEAHPTFDRLVPVDGADHGNVPQVMGIETYQDTLARFVAGFLP